MLKNQRLNWRALAVLGALLSVMLTDWPTGAAMPIQSTTAASQMYHTSNLFSNSQNRNNSNNMYNINFNNNSNTQFVSFNNHSDSSTSDFSFNQTTLVLEDDKFNPRRNKRKRKKADSSGSSSTSTSSLSDSISSSNSDTTNSSISHSSDTILENSVRTQSESVFEQMQTSTASSSSSSSSSSSPSILSRTDRSIHDSSKKSRRLNNNNISNNANSSSLDRNERSTFAHLLSPSRKIQLYIKNRYIQLLPDGTVNGTEDELSDYTVLQRSTVDVGRIKIQGVATCLYLCMDACGSVYGSKTFSDDCVFNESMEQHNYNTYSSTYNSNSRRILYLALNRRGELRKMQIPPTRPLGKLATYTKAITETVAQERVERLIAEKFGANRIKHGIRQLCDVGKPLVELTEKTMRTRPVCNISQPSNVPVANDKSRLSSSVSNSSNIIANSISGHNSNSSSSTKSNLKKKKKKKRRCRPGETEAEHNCRIGGPQALKKRPQKAKCKEGEECVKKGGKKGGKKQGRNNNNNNNHRRAGGNNGKKKNDGGPGKRKPRTTTLKTTTIQTSPSTTFVQTTTITQSLTSTEVHDHDQDETSSEEALFDDLDDDEDVTSAFPFANDQHIQLVGGGDDFLYDDDDV